MLHQPGMMSICSPVITELGEHSVGALMRNRNVERAEKEKKHFINFPPDTLDQQANHLEMLGQSHQHEYNQYVYFLKNQKTK